MERMNGDRHKKVMNDETERLFLAAVDDHRAGRLKRAIAGYQRTLARTPDHADVLNNLGVALRAAGHRPAALACYERVTAIAPENAEHLSNKGNVLRDLDRFAEAEEALTRAADLAPGNINPLFNLALVMRDTNRLDEAVGLLDRVLAVNPDHADAHLDRALIIMRRAASAKSFADGLAEYEWRWKQSTLSPRALDKPLWDGAPLKGRTLLIRQEQGYGDAIQMVRYAAKIGDNNKNGGRVIIECRPRLTRLLGRAAGVGGVVVVGEPLPDFDCHAPVMSLPWILGTTPDTISKTVPAAGRYLEPPADAVAGFDASGDGRLKVGFAWAGNPGNRDDRRRSCDVAHFVDLFGLPGLSFYNLQKGAPVEALLQATGGALYVDAEKNTRDFADSAAATDALDLVITVDTVTAHLAGALGKPVWILLPFHADWRWFEDLGDTPWYPSARLFRQPRPGDWEAVFRQVGKALAAETTSPRPN